MPELECAQQHSGASHIGPINDFCVNSVHNSWDVLCNWQGIRFDRTVYYFVHSFLGTQ